MFDRFLIDFGGILVTKIDKKSKLMLKNEAETVWAANNEPGQPVFAAEASDASENEPQIQ